MATGRLSEAEIGERMRELANWTWDRAASRIERNLEFADFRAAIAFLVRLAFEAEEADHHPDISLSYRRLRLGLSTHSEKGLTEKDFKLAAKIDKLFGGP